MRPSWSAVGIKMRPAKETYRDRPLRPNSTLVSLVHRHRGRHASMSIKAIGHLCNRQRNRIAGPVDLSAEQRRAWRGLQTRGSTLRLRMAVDEDASLAAAKEIACRCDRRARRITSNKNGSSALVQNGRLKCSQGSCANRSRPARRTCGGKNCSGAL